MGRERNEKFYELCYIFKLHGFDGLPVETCRLDDRLDGDSEGLQLADYFMLRFSAAFSKTFGTTFFKPPLLGILGSGVYYVQIIAHVFQ